MRPRCCERGTGLTLPSMSGHGCSNPSEGQLNRPLAPLATRPVHPGGEAPRWKVGDFLVAGVNACPPTPARRATPALPLAQPSNVRRGRPPALRDRDRASGVPSTCGMGIPFASLRAGLPMRAHGRDARATVLTLLQVRHLPTQPFADLFAARIRPGWRRRQKRDRCPVPRGRRTGEGRLLLQDCRGDHHRVLQPRRGAEYFSPGRKPWGQAPYPPLRGPPSPAGRGLGEGAAPILPWLTPWAKVLRPSRPGNHARVRDSIHNS
jgi:hypothetical protein